MPMIPKLIEVGRRRNRLYKPERRPARKKGVLGHQQAPVGCPDASTKEIAMALASLCEASHVIPGRGGEYDALKDEYVVVGKSKLTRKAQDFKVEGFAVAYLIQTLRAWNGGQPFDPQALTKAVDGV